MIKYDLLFKISHQFKTKKETGFTLIELLVTVIIIGILAAVAMPNLISQVQKSRQTEAKNNLGSINRAQQSERFEEGTFVLLADLPITITSKYYTYADAGVPDSLQAIYTATVITKFERDMLDYSAAISQIVGGNNTSVICEQNIADGAISPIIPTVTSGITNCSTGTTRVF